ncbi:hypothetical protein [Burkholderia sp. IMCC1007]|uniref:hypothetical protein n=1 Tax=Burkholderia sp. IMCC1007 TaxID=3004104 RepID=UPI0022B3305B|nr:hypothetical protein [Burkholderia sp. IMCC1007]
MHTVVIGCRPLGNWHHQRRTLGIPLAPLEIALLQPSERTGKHVALPLPKLHLARLSHCVAPDAHDSLLPNPLSAIANGMPTPRVRGSLQDERAPNLCKTASTTCI